MWLTISCRRLLICRSTHHSIIFVFLLCVFAAMSQILIQTMYLPTVALDNAAWSISNISEVFNTRTKDTNQRKVRSNHCWDHLDTEANDTQTIGKESISEKLSRPCGRLRRDWSQMDLKSAIARKMHGHQTNCSLPVMTFHMDNSYGMGSHLHMWSQAVCNAWEAGYRLQTYNPDWLWLDKSYCDKLQAEKSPLLCYFPVSDSSCSLDETLPKLDLPNPRNRGNRCSWVKRRRDLTAFRAASMEYLFQSVSQLVIQEADRQIGLIFGEQVPEDLIAVHIRWGDKKAEMDLPKIDEYVAAVHLILQSQNRDNTTTAHIYLATEDPEAVEAFRKAANPKWKIYVDQTIEELNTFRGNGYNAASMTARRTKGRAGLIALASLLLTLEANSFVLTTQSNWSRLMDELRRSVIDPRCGNCTQVVDLRPGSW